MGWCRKPRTTQELRELHGSRVDYREDEDIPRVRNKRRNIPTWYDDRQVAAREDRNWKKYRKTQWRPKKLPKKKKKTSKFRGYTEVSSRWGWRGKQRFDKKKVWSWQWARVGSQWNPHKVDWMWVYCGGQNPYRRDYRYGGWEEVYGWKWVSKTPTVTITNGYKTTRYPEMKRDSNGVWYFTGEWKEKVKKCMGP